jgi:hypothetical protein
VETVTEEERNHEFQQLGNAGYITEIRKEDTF